MRKYGVENFYVETLEICDVTVLDEREMYYIDLYNSVDKSKGYNVSIGGNTPRFKRKTLSLNELVNLYVNEKFTLEQIAEKYNVSRYIIRTELRNANVAIRDRHASATRYTKLQKSKIVNALNKCGSLRAAAKFLNVKYSTFRKSCIYYNIEYNSPTSARHSN